MGPVSDRNTPSSTPSGLSKVFDYAPGHHEFKSLYFKEHETEYLRLVENGQTPSTLYIGCSDSRIIPDLILGTKPGDLFIIRTAGNLVPKYSPDIAWDGVAASIEYAVSVLQVSDIIVCGHSHCGAIKELLEPQTTPEQIMIKKWLALAEKAKQIMALLSTASSKPTLAEKCAITEHISVICQLDHLMSFPFIKKKVDEGDLFLHGWYYTIETGEIDYYDTASYKFHPLDSAAKKKHSNDLL